MSTLLVKELLHIVNEYKSGKLSQSEALDKLENEYTSAITNNKKNITEIMEKNAYYRFIDGGRDALISLYDNSMNYTSETERKEYDIIFKRIVGEYLVNQLAFLPDYELKKITQEELDIANVDIYKERTEITNLCKEERKIKEYYETYMVEIMKIYTKQPQQENIPKMEEHYLMQILKHEAKPAYEYLKKAVDIKLVQYTATGYFNFLCDRGCVGYFFGEAGYSDFKRISPYILINGEPCDVETLRNGAKHGNTAEWNAIGKAIFGE